MNKNYRGKSQTARLTVFNYRIIRREIFGVCRLSSSAVDRRLSSNLENQLLLSALFGFHRDYGYLPEMDNIYQEGIFIYAKVAPDRRLVIDRYYKRIYYCRPVDDPSDKLLVYFERELTLPTV